MSVRVIVFENALDPEPEEVHEAPELVPWLRQRLGNWPRTARLYRRVGSVEYDITPQTPEEAEQLEGATGTFVVRVYPAGIVKTGAELYANIFTLGLYGQAKNLIFGGEVPNIETPAQRTRKQIGGSPNNAMGRRSNEARPEQRIPYILGAVRSVPDLLSVPYTTYVDHVEHETAYYCVGEGTHSVSDIRDGDILISQIRGASAQVYGPGDAPTGGVTQHEPQDTIGDSIGDDVYTTYAVEAVNGQELHGFSDFTFYGASFPTGEIDDNEAVRNRFEYLGGSAGRISLPYNAAPDEILGRLEIGDKLHVNWPTEHLPAGTGTAPDLTTPVTSLVPVVVSSLTVTDINVDASIALVHVDVTIPSAQQAQWALLSTYFGESPVTFPFARVTNLRELYAGPIFIDFEHPAPANDFEIVCNFVAPRGLVADDGVTTRRLNVSVQVIVTPADADGNPNGTPQSFSGVLEGSAVARGQRALTLRCKPVGLTSTKVLVQARKLTNSPRRWRLTDVVEEDLFGADIDADPPRYAHFSGQVEDEVRWTHCYSMTKPPNISFGNVTTIHTRTVATTGALRVKNRRLNCLALRHIQVWDGSEFGGVALPNDRTENVLFTVMKDSSIGNLEDANIDFEGIVAAMDLVRTSVYSEEPQEFASTRFNHTFDDADISFEETVQAICQSAFCVAYRDGDVIKVRPEIANDDAAILLNHRNTTLGSQRITHSFGAPTENDSIEVAYVDPSDNAQSKVSVPKFGTKLRPREIKVIGLRSRVQAYWHAYRAYHRMLYQRQSLTVEAAAEAELLGTRQRVLVANETRQGAQAGDVLAVSGSTVRTSQPVALSPGRSYVLRLQQSDGSVASFPVTSSPSTRELVVTGTPSVVTDTSAGVPALYLLEPADEPAPSAYLVTSRQSAGAQKHQIEAVNYSHMYYFADGLTTWVDFGSSSPLSDLSPQQRTLSKVGGAPITGGEWVGTGNAGEYFELRSGFGTDHQTDSYCCALWVTSEINPGNSDLVSTVDGTSQSFRITNLETTPFLVAGNDGGLQVTYNYSLLVGQEHLVAVTYDEDSGRIALLVDGELVAEASAPPAPANNPLRYLLALNGTCRQVMKWGRWLSDREIMEIYLRTRET